MITAHSNVQVVDIISPKCFVVVPKREIALTIDSKPVKLILKTLAKEEVTNYCKTDNPDLDQVESIIDNWIYMTPVSKHITKAYAVYRDGGGEVKTSFMQLTQFKEGYDNVFNHIKLMDLGSMIKAVPEKLHKLVFLFAMQVSQAFEYAH